MELWQSVHKILHMVKFLQGQKCKDYMCKPLSFSDLKPISFFSVNVTFVQLQMVLLPHIFSQLHDVVGTVSLSHCYKLSLLLMIQILPTPALIYRGKNNDWKFTLQL